MLPRESLVRQQGYVGVLALVVVTAVYAVATPDSDGWHLGVVLLQSVIALAVIHTARPSKRVSVAIGLLVSASLVIAVVSLFGAGSSRAEFSVLSATLAALPPLVVGRSLIRTLREEGASEKAIGAAMSVYLLLGMLCAYLYGAIGEIGGGELFAGRGDGTLSDHVYFSFVTQTTVGYGDLAPIEPVARAVAMAQALTGSCIS